MNRLNPVSGNSENSFRNVSFLFPLSGRNARIEQISSGQAPSEFFYGGLAFERENGALGYVDLRKDPVQFVQRGLLFFERLRNRWANFGLSKQRVVAFSEDIPRDEMVISFTDSGSLSIGRYRESLSGNPVLIGGFHGLCDIAAEVSPWARGWAKREIRKSLSGLDYCFFFGEKDREEAIKLYGVDPSRSRVFPFGVDLAFWRPGLESDKGKDDLIFSVGSDPKRDYPCLIGALGDRHKARIITRLRIDPSSISSNVELVSGSLHGSQITDLVLRDLYWRSKMVVVPVRNVIQPSGYSVSLQAMACGKPVIISSIDGLWDRKILKHGENCILVPPGDTAALRDAIELLDKDDMLRNDLGRAARETAVNHFGLERMDNALLSMVEDLRSVYPKENRAA
ncbi:hypothetical protein COO92_01425 [Thalassospira lohafexi]|uniref:Uncharacterized protein n=1 Tax=Thalassospira lohafexi TaxID=744227 RepID=A0A2N3LB52_9PROT|nr:hypothetical protein COO92_01425 [Thalassospira lohafexi]